MKSGHFFKVDAYPKRCFWADLLFNLLQKLQFVFEKCLLFITPFEHFIHRFLALIRLLSRHYQYWAWKLQWFKHRIYQLYNKRKFSLFDWDCFYWRYCNQKYIDRSLLFRSYLLSSRYSFRVSNEFKFASSKCNVSKFELVQNLIFNGFWRRYWHS